jgi:hypothetical protein
MCLQMMLDFFTHKGSQGTDDTGPRYLWGHSGAFKITNLHWKQKCDVLNSNT